MNQSNTTASVENPTTSIDLISLVASRTQGIDVSGTYIDQVVPESTLHKFPDEKILSIAYGLGFRIDARDGMYRANGVWVNPAYPLSDELRSYQNVNYLCYDRCTEGQGNNRQVKHKPGLLEDMADTVLSAGILALL